MNHLSFLPRWHYAVETNGAQYLRPWMLAWRADSGCSGYMEPDQLISIAELICSEGLLTGNVVIFMCRFNDESVCNLSENNDHIS